MQTDGCKTLKSEQQVCPSPQQGVSWARAEQTHNTTPQTLLEGGKKTPSFLKILSSVWIWGDFIISNKFRSLNQLKSCVVQGLTHPLHSGCQNTLFFGPKKESHLLFWWIPQGTPQVMAATSNSQLLPIFSYSLVKGSQSFRIRVKCPFPWGKSFLVNVSRQNKIKDITLRLKWLYPNQIMLQASCFEPLRGRLIGQQLRLFWVFLLHKKTLHLK